jgi:hypothetical protein
VPVLAGTLNEVEPELQNWDLKCSCKCWWRTRNWSVPRTSSSLDYVPYFDKFFASEILFNAWRFGSAGCGPRSIGNSWRFLGLDSAWLLETCTDPDSELPVRVVIKDGHGDKDVL